MRGITGKRVLVAGSAQGIGEATAMRYGAEGARVVLGDINVAGAEDVAQRIRDAGGDATVVGFDLHDEASLDHLVATTVELLGGLDVVALVAADLSPNTLGKDVGVLDMDPAVWRRTLDADLIAYALLSKAAAPHMIAAGGGAFVSVTSGSWHAGEPVRVAYAAAKAGVNALTRHLATTLGEHGVRANTVSAGMVMTPGAIAGTTEEFRAEQAALIALRRLGKPEDLANTIVYLSSDDSDWITGQVWTIDGGVDYRE